MRNESRQTDQPRMSGVTLATQKSEAVKGVPSWYYI